eukprot:SAG11_NODE_1870_length_4151_cov_2.279368_3_plen_96_part_00
MMSRVRVGRIGLFYVRQMYVRGTIAASHTQHPCTTRAPRQHMQQSSTAEARAVGEWRGRFKYAASCSSGSLRRAAVVVKVAGMQLELCWCEELWC